MGMRRNVNKMEIDSKPPQSRWVHQTKTNEPSTVIMDAERQRMINSNSNINQMPKKEVIKQPVNKTTDQLQARLQVLLGTEAPNIPSVVSNLLSVNEDKQKKKKKRKKKKRNRSRSRSRSRA